MEGIKQSKPIKGFRDLIVYQKFYWAMVLVHTKVIISLPKEEKYDLVNQMKRASKAAPALIAEGFAKRFQKRQWLKYINDTLGEGNEMIHHLSVCLDVYPQYIDIKLCRDLIDFYDVGCKQLVRLGQSWQDFHKNR